MYPIMPFYKNTLMAATVQKVVTVLVTFLRPSVPSDVTHSPKMQENLYKV